MYEIKKIGKVFTSKSAGTGPLSYGKIIYQAAVSQSLRNTGLVNHNHIHIVCTSLNKLTILYSKQNYIFILYRRGKSE